VDDKPERSYFLCRLVTCGEAGIPISAERFKQLEEAKAALGQMLDIEENYNSVIEHYIDLNEKIVRVVVSMAIQHALPWSDFAAWIQRINRTLVDLLNCAKQYMDFDGRLLGAIRRATGIEPFDFEKWKVDHRALSFGFRVIEFIRNESQHAALPVQAFTVGGGWVEEEDVRVRRHGCTLYIVPDELSPRARYEREIVDELKAFGDRVDLLALLREYLCGLSSLHEEVRKAFEPHCEKWSGLIDAALEEYRTKYGDTIGLHAVAQEGNKIVEQVSLFPDLDLRRKTLERINSASEHTFDFEVMTSAKSKTPLPVPFYRRKPGAGSE
jgi:hypothetical protein